MISIDLSLLVLANWSDFTITSPNYLLEEDNSNILLEDGTFIQLES